MKDPLASPQGMLVLVGSVAMIYGFSALPDAVDGMGWETIPGTVVSSEMKSRITPDGMDEHLVDIEYTYTAGGRERTSTRVKEGDEQGKPTRYADRAEAEGLVARFPTGATVDVWLDPERPARAVLVKEFSAAPVMWLIGGLLAAIAGVFWFIRKGRREKLKA